MDQWRWSGSDRPAAEPAPAIAEPDQGGDPACWLSRVCPECGYFAEHEQARSCADCGAPLPGASA